MGYTLKSSSMKKYWMAVTLVSMLILSACGDGKLSLDDPNAMAKWQCEKMHEWVDLNADPEKNLAKINTLKAEMDQFEVDFNAHHGAKANEMLLKMDAEMKIVCTDLDELIQRMPR
jgi:hypothetical protein